MSKADGVLRWGVLGSAKITEAEVGPAMLRSTRSVVSAVGSRRLESATALAGTLGAASAYGSYEELLDDPEVDAVYNPLPNTLHKEWTIAALRAGKHVLCEKPMGMSADEVREMIAAAGDAGRHLMEGFMWRFHPRVARVQQLIADGAVGELRLVRATYTFDLAAASDVRSGSVDSDIRLNPAMGGGALTDLGTYCVNGMRVYSGGHPVSVRSRCASTPGRLIETSVSGEISFDNGVTGQFFAALDIPGGGHVEILGTGGRIRMANAFRIRKAQAPFDIEIQQPGGSWLTETVPFCDQYELEIDHFASVVLDGIAPIVTTADSLENALTLDAIRRSWDEGDVEIKAS